MSLLRHWSSPVATYLQEAIADTRSDGDDPPLAVFDFDNTCVQNDVGEAFHVFLIEEQVYDFDTVVTLIPDEDGGVFIAELWAQLQPLSPAERLKHHAFVPFRNELLACYVRRLERLGKADTYRWHIRLLAGLTRDTVTEAAAACVQHVTQRPISAENVIARDTRFTLNHGIRPNPPVQALMKTLRDAGWDVWIVSASNQWIIQAGAPLMDVAPGRAVGGRLTTDSQGRLQSTVDEPYTVGAGKVAAIDAFIGRRPQLAMGDSYTDQEMLESADRAVIIDRGDSSFRRHAEERGWGIQPAWWL